MAPSRKTQRCVEAILLCAVSVLIFSLRDHQMADIILRRIQVWIETQNAAYKIGAPPSLKFDRAQVPCAKRQMDLATVFRVEDVDCLECARDIQQRGLHPVVLNLSDDLCAGGAVDAGSGAQEESLWRRTALCVTQTQEFYPLCGKGRLDLIYSTGVPVLRTSEATDYAWLPAPWYCDFIACPALKYPELVRTPGNPERDIKQKDEATLEDRLRLILDVAAHMGNSAVVLGAMGCGAWRTPVGAVARVFGRVLPDYNGVFREITVAILTTEGSSLVPQFREVLRLG